MVSLAGSQIWWTYEVEDAFRQAAAGDKYAVKKLATKLTGQLNELVSTVHMDLAKLMRKKVNTLLIIDVHARDIVDMFVRERYVECVCVCACAQAPACPFWAARPSRPPTFAR